MRWTFPFFRHLGWMVLLVMLTAGGLRSVSAADSAETGSRVDRSLGPPFEQRKRAMLGSEAASVIFFEVSDFRCEHCRLFHERVFPRLKQRFVDTGLVRYVAIPTLPPDGQPAPELFGAARFAIEAGRFWDVQSAFFSSAKSSDLAAWARLVGTTPDELRTFVRSPQVAADLAADRAEVARLGVKGTPTFILRKRQADGTFVEALVEGYDSFEYFERFILDLLKE